MFLSNKIASYVVFVFRKATYFASAAGSYQPEMLLKHQLFFQSSLLSFLLLSELLFQNQEAMQSVMLHSVVPG